MEIFYISLNFFASNQPGIEGSGAGLSTDDATFIFALRGVPTARGFLSLGVAVKALFFFLLADAIEVFGSVGVALGGSSETIDNSASDAANDSLTTRCVGALGDCCEKR
jgi:hypothetical protein